MPPKSTKRPRKDEPDHNHDFGRSSKVYIIKLSSDKSSDFQSQLKPTSGANIVKLHSFSGERSDPSPETILPDDCFKTDQKHVIDLESDDEEDELLIDEESESIHVPLELIQGTSQLNDSDEFDQPEPNDDLECSLQASAFMNQNEILSNTYQSTDEYGENDTFTESKKLRGWCANRHKLRFQQKWLTEFPFIEYDAENNVMYCRACRKYVNDWRKTSPFVIGNRNFRPSMLKYHQRSSMHIESQELADTVASEGNEAAEKDLYKDQLSHVFKSVYFIFKNKMPYTHYPQLCESQKREGTEFSVYASHLKVVPLIGKFISMAFEKEVGQKISNIAEFSLVIDASFRRNIESHDLVYLKYLDNSMVRTVFLGVIDSSAKLHDSIFSILNDLFKKYGITRWVDKVVYIFTDKSDCHLWREGLINLIKSMSPRIFFTEVSYLSHKVKYCSIVVQNHKITSTFDALLWSIYCYYERVGKGKKNLMHMNKELDDIIECYGNLPKNSYTTLYFEALKAIEKDYAGFVHLLETEQMLIHCDVKVRKAGARILSVITRCSFLCKLALFIDIFSCLNDFATKLSSEDLLPYDVHILLDEVCADIEQAANVEGPTSLEVIEELSATSCFFRGVELVEDSSINHILPEVKKFSTDVISYLKSLINDDSLLEKCFIFNIAMWPEDKEIEDFGNPEFVDIYGKFNGEKHLDLALAEWNKFKTDLLSLFPVEDRQNSKSVISKVVSEHEKEYPYVVSVLKKILLLNFESTEIKRGYHEMCLNKSFSRSMLSLQSLQTSMMISMYGPSLSEFDFSLALELFLNSRPRKFRKKIIDKKLLFF